MSEELEKASSITEEEVDEILRESAQAWVKPVSLRGTDAARVVQVIETQAVIGAGTERDPCRPLIQYWDFDGNLLAQQDTWVKKGK